MANTSKLAALVLCAAMVAGSLFAAAPAKALDTNNVWFVDIRGAASPPVGYVFNDVEWEPNGKFALFVGDDGGGACAAYWYDPAKTGDAAWTLGSFDVGGPVSSTFRAVEWYPDDNHFIIIGDALTGYWYTATNPSADISEKVDISITAYVEDLAYVAGIGMYGAGRNGVNGYLYLYDKNTMDWALVAGGMVGSANWLSCQYYSGKIYCCGSDGGSGGVYAYYSLPAGPWTYPYTTGNFQFADMVLDDSDVGNERMLLVNKNRAVDLCGIYEATGALLSNLDPLATLDTEYDLNAIAIDDDGFAIVVGRDGGTGNGLVYDLWRTGSATTVMKRSVAAPPFSGQTFQGVAIRPTGVQMALVAGSAFKYSYTSVVGPIQVDTGVPHIDYIDLFPTGTGVGSSVLNSQIDVDIGDSLTQYTLEMRVYDNLGVGRLTGVEVWLWYDELNTTVDFPTDITPAFDTPGHENTRMHFTVTSGGAVSQLYPATGVDEETSLIGGSWNPIDGTTAVVRINFSPHQQVRWADAAAGVFNEAGGTRYDPGMDGPDPEDQSDNVGAAPLDDADTWDIKVNLTDDAPTTNTATAYDEFGFYKYTYLGAAGIPNGGAVYGSGAPGTNNVPLSVSGSDVTYCANCPYDLTVTLGSDLLGSGAPFIDASAISIQGGNLGAMTPFGSGGSAIVMIGGPQAPLDSFRTTTTSSWDGDGGSLEPVMWECDIPGVPEDSYVSTVTWAITN